MRKKDTMTKSQRKVVRAVQLGAADTGHVIGQSLRTLREAAGVTPKQMGARLKLALNSIMGIEKDGNVPVRLLRRYVEALGATLSIEAKFPTSQSTADQFNQKFLSPLPNGK